MNKKLDATIPYLAQIGHFKELLELSKEYQGEMPPQVILAVATGYLNENQAEEALNLILQAEKKGWDLPDIMMMKSRCLFSLGEYISARHSIQQIQQVECSSEFDHWAKRCEAH